MTTKDIDTPNQIEKSYSRNKVIMFAVIALIIGYFIGFYSGKINQITKPLR